MREHSEAEALSTPLLNPNPKSAMVWIARVAALVTLYHNVVSGLVALVEGGAEAGVPRLRSSGLSSAGYGNGIT